MPSKHMPKVLFVASEAHPLIKTGGLGDVCGSLPIALQKLGIDVRLLLPAYPQTKALADKLRVIAKIDVPHGARAIALLEGVLPGTQVKVWLVDYPPAFDRPGHPYLDARGHPWFDNAPRFALFAEVASALALAKTPISWHPDIVHCHDWQTGLVPALLTLHDQRPATLFTIHNLVYQGVFSADTFAALRLPAALWSMHALEFHDQLSFIKGGVVFADHLTTVSPTYAREIQSPEFGAGLDGLLRTRADRLSGILNGIDISNWNPARDRFLAKRYSRQHLADKLPNKLALQKEFGFTPDRQIPLVGMVGRLVEQKGVDLVLNSWPMLADLPLQLVILGSGEEQYERAWRWQSMRASDRLATHIGYDEGLAHRIEGGADIFLMPSRFEPCGLNQMYSLRYGTIPIVRRVGGLADTVVDAQPKALKQGSATGIVFDDTDPAALRAAVVRALALYRNARHWRRMMQTGMQQDFSWRKSARAYIKLYKISLRNRN